jgi:hypothetical protein
MYASKPGDVLTADQQNEQKSLQNFKIIYEGTVDDSMSDSGTTELTPADYNYAIMFKTGSGITELSRIELDVASDGSGEDLTIEIRGNDFNPDGSDEGTLLKTVVIPKEFLPASQAYFKIAIALTGLTAETAYWIIVLKAGDGTNHAHIYSKGSEKDTNHKTYKRSESSGIWTDCSDSVRFACYQGNSGENIVHFIYATNMVETYIYNGEDLETIYRYMPPSDDAAGGIRKIQTITYDGEYLTEGS